MTPEPEIVDPQEKNKRIKSSERSHDDIHDIKCRRQSNQETDLRGAAEISEASAPQRCTGLDPPRHPDRTRIAAGTYDEFMCLTEVTNGRALTELRNPRRAHTSCSEPTRQLYAEILVERTRAEMFQGIDGSRGDLVEDWWGETGQKVGEKVEKREREKEAEKKADGVPPIVLENTAIDEDHWARRKG